MAKKTAKKTAKKAAARTTRKATGKKTPIKKKAAGKAVRKAAKKTTKKTARKAVKKASRKVSKKAAPKKTAKAAPAAKKAPAKKKTAKTVSKVKAAAPGKKPVKKARRGKYLTKKELEFYRSLLIGLREKVAGNVNFLSTDSLRPMEGSEEDPDSMDYDLTLGLAGNEQNILYEIEEALRRIDEGTYGICELTGNEISKPRLKALPYTRLCVEAQSQQEHGRFRPSARRFL